MYCLLNRVIKRLEKKTQLTNFTMAMAVIIIVVVDWFKKITIILSWKFT